MINELYARHHLTHTTSISMNPVELGKHYAKCVSPPFCSHTKALYWWDFALTADEGTYHPHMVTSTEHKLMKNAFSAVMMFRGDSNLPLNMFDLHKCLDTIHQENVLHCDLRRPNLLHFPPFKNYANGRSFIVDFGESVILQHGEESKLIKFGKEDSRPQILYGHGILADVKVKSFLMNKRTDIAMLSSAPQQSLSAAVDSNVRLFCNNNNSD